MFNSQDNVPTFPETRLLLAYFLKYEDLAPRIRVRRAPKDVVCSQHQYRLRALINAGKVLTAWCVPVLGAGEVHIVEFVAIWVVIVVIKASGIRFPNVIEIVGAVRVFVSNDVTWCCIVDA